MLRTETYLRLERKSPSQVSYSKCVLSWLFSAPWTGRASPGKNTEAGCHFLLQGSSQPRDQTRISCVSCAAGWFFTPEPRFFQNQTHNTSHFVQLIPFTFLKSFSPPRISDIFYFLWLWERWLSHEEKNIQNLGCFFQLHNTRDQTPDVHCFRFMERTVKLGRCFADYLSQHQCF